MVIVIRRAWYLFNFDAWIQHRQINLVDGAACAWLFSAVTLNAEYMYRWFFVDLFFVFVPGTKKSVCLCGIVSYTHSHMCSGQSLDCVSAV